MTTWNEIEGKRLKVELEDNGRVTVDGTALQIGWVKTEPGVYSLLWTDEAGQCQSFRCVLEEGAVVLNGERVDYTRYDPRSLSSAGAVAGKATGPKPLKAPMPGRIVRVMVAAGEAVDAGQGCIVLEAMKMQNELKAPRAGVVARLIAVVGESVAVGATLLVIE